GLNSAINQFRSSNNPSAGLELLPNHSFKTQYRYNTLNQLVWQYTPDGGETRFAYDELGRIVASQNANQNEWLIQRPSLTLPSQLTKHADGTIEKTTNNSTWYGGNTSSNVLSGDGFVEYTIGPDSNTNVIVGLAYINSSNVQT